MTTKKQPELINFNREVFDRLKAMQHAWVHEGLGVPTLGELIELHKLTYPYH